MILLLPFATAAIWPQSPSSAQATPEPFGAGLFTDTYRGTFTPDGNTLSFFRPGRDLYFVRDFSAFYHVPLTAALDR